MSLGKVEWKGKDQLLGRDADLPLSEGVKCYLVEVIEARRNVRIRRKTK